jgi:lipopolysaccharide export system protein LptA
MMIHSKPLDRRHAAKQLTTCLMSLKTLALFVVITPLVFLATCLHAQSANHSVIQKQAVTIVSDQSEYRSGYLLYHDATAKMTNGTAIYADDLKQLIVNGKFGQIVATGDVKSTVVDPQGGNYVVTANQGTYDPSAKTINLSGNVRMETSSADAGIKSGAPIRKYSVVATSDNAVYDLTKNIVNLNGDVKTVIDNEYTEGPIVQTGTSAVIVLRKSPGDTQDKDTDYPQIDMQQVHTQFTLKQ